MARGHIGLPKATDLYIAKQSLLASLAALDKDRDAVKRVLAMETDFRERIATHVEALPLNDAIFAKFNTNPFVLLIHTFNKKYKHVSQIEQDILPAKLFSSMETSAGRMIEQVVLPIYGWRYVPSEMHSENSLIDGKQKARNLLRLATLKSGPRCLNDEMSANIADDIIKNVAAWAKADGVTEVDFTYGVLYGTKKQSNKKDWHILRNLEEKLPKKAMKTSPTEQWHCAFNLAGVKVTVTVRVGIELWNHFANDKRAFLEMTCAIIRACVSPSEVEPAAYRFAIQDLAGIISLATVPSDFNVAILQRSQFEWLFFFARHFCDGLQD